MDGDDLTCVAEDGDAAPVPATSERRIWIESAATIGKPEEHSPNELEEGALAGFIRTVKDGYGLSEGAEFEVGEAAETVDP